MTATHATTNRSQSATTPPRTRSTNLRHRARPNHPHGRFQPTPPPQHDGVVGGGSHAVRLPVESRSDIGRGPGAATLRSGCAGGALDGARQLDARGDVELAEDVAQVRL